MKKNIFKLGIFVAICGFLIGNVSYATTEFVSPEAPATPVFKFILYNPGEYFVSYEDGKMEQITSDFLLNPQYKKSLIQAAEYWDSILKRPASATTLVPIYVTTKNTEGAFGGSVEVTTDSSPYKISYLNALYNNKAVPTEEAKKQ